MKITKSIGLTQAEIILTMVNTELQYWDTKRTMSIEPFYNCRESGYILRINADFKAIKTIVVCNQRNTDEPSLCVVEGWAEWNEELYKSITRYETVIDCAKALVDLVKD